jgi:hypothetical protein
MKLRELKIEISEELLESLKRASENQSISEEKLAVKLLQDGLAKSGQKEVEEKAQVPSVALIKNDFHPDLSPISPQEREKQISPLLNDPRADRGASFIKRRPALSPEKQQRKKELEEKMKEVSLLIETAESEEKKEEYLQRYAELAAEMEALL